MKMFFRFTLLLFIAQCAFGGPTKLTEDEQFEFLKRANNLMQSKAKLDAYTWMNFDAELEAEILKMSCDELEKQRGIRFFESKLVNVSCRKMSKAQAQIRISA